MHHMADCENMTSSTKLGEMGIKYHNTAREEPRYNHSQYVQTIWQSLAICFFDVQVDRYTDTFITILRSTPRGKLKMNG